MAILGTKWFGYENVKTGNEMTKISLDISEKVGTKWPNWERNDQNEKKSGYDEQNGTKWPGYKITWVQNDWKPYLYKSGMYNTYVYTKPHVRTTRFRHYGFLIYLI